MAARRVVRPVLNHDGRLGKEPAAFNQRAQRRRREAGAIRGVEQGQVASLDRRRQAGRVAGDDGGSGAAAQGLDVGAQHAPHVGFTFDGGQRRGAAGERFQPERAGTCEQIDDMGAFEGSRHPAVKQDVEQRLAHPLSGRAHTHAGRCPQPAAAQATADDPHAPSPACCRAAREARAAGFRRSRPAQARPVGRARRPCG